MARTVLVVEDRELLALLCEDLLDVLPQRPVVVVVATREDVKVALREVYWDLVLLSNRFSLITGCRTLVTDPKTDPVELVTAVRTALGQ